MVGTHANVRIGAAGDGLPSVGDIAPMLAVPGTPTCSECGSVLGARRHPTTFCSPRCRAAASRRRRLEADLAKLAAVEATLLSALLAVRAMRQDLIQRSP